jgi:PAS domain S-box-containing protein
MTYVNPSWTQISGLSIKGIGNGWLDAVHEEDRKPFFIVGKCYRKSEKNIVEYRFVKPDGTIAWVMVKPFK